MDYELNCFWELFLLLSGLCSCLIRNKDCSDHHRMQVSRSTSEYHDLIGVHYLHRADKLVLDSQYCLVFKNFKGLFLFYVLCICHTLFWTFGGYSTLTVAVFCLFIRITVWLKPYSDPNFTTIQVMTCTVHWQCTDLWWNDDVKTTAKW